MNTNWFKVARIVYTPNWICTVVILDMDIYSMRKLYIVEQKSTSRRNFTKTVILHIIPYAVIKGYTYALIEFKF